MGTLAKSYVVNESRSVSKKLIISYLTCIMAGALLPFAFAPFHYWPLSLLSPLILLWRLQKSNPLQAFWQSLFFGLGFFGLGVSWVFVSIHYFGNTDVPLAVFLTFLFVFVLSLFLAVQGYLLKRFFKGSPLSFCLLGFPCIWVLFEWLRTVLFGGFPWAFLGYAVLETPLRGIAPFLSVYGVSWLILLSCGALLALLQEKGWTKTLMLVLLAVIWLGSEGLSYLKFTQPISRNYRVAMIQGNIPPLDKFSAENPVQSIEDSYGHLTNEHWNNDLILWPENAISFPLPYAASYVAKLKTRAEAYGSNLITGIQTRVNHQDYYNSLIMLGTSAGIYHKKHLVPFGEFLPFDKYLRGLINFFDIPMSNFIEGPENQPLLKMDDNKIKIAPLICYEIAYPELVRTSLKDANVIVTLSEDGWFGKSLGPHQHLQIAQMRALETGRYVLRATTSGISAIIRPDGSIAERSPQFEANVLSGQFEAREGNTPWMMIGIWPLLILCLLGFLIPKK